MNCRFLMFWENIQWSLMLCCVDAVHAVYFSLCQWPQATQQHVSNELRNVGHFLNDRNLLPALTASGHHGNCKTCVMHLLRCKICKVGILQGGGNKKQQHNLTRAGQISICGQAAALVEVSLMNSEGSWESPTGGRAGLVICWLVKKCRGSGA